MDSVTTLPAASGELTGDSAVRGAHMADQQAQGVRRGSPAVLRHQLGTRLRQLREECSLRLEEVATTLDIAPSTLSRIETGKAPARTSYVQMMLDKYSLTDSAERRLLIDIAREGQRKEWCAESADLLSGETIRYLGLESSASEVRAFGALILPGLIQSAVYAYAAQRAARPGVTAKTAHQLAAITMRRQEFVCSSRARVHVVLDEAALLRPAGSALVMAGQLDSLATLIAQERVTIQVVELATAWPVLAVPFTVLSFPDAGHPDVACIAGFGSELVTTTHQREVADLHEVFAQLASAALPVVDSARLIGELAARGRSSGAR
jgi:transcriptional regulator with XRE-family HTH domain